MATLTKSTGTVTLTGAAEKVTLPAVYGWVWIKNMSDGDIFAGLSADISEGADGVMTIPAGECGRIQTDGFLSVYLLGTGKALVVAQNYADCPFKAVKKGGGISEQLGIYPLDPQTGLPYGDIVVPNGVTKLYQTFKNNSNITSVTLSDSVTEVGYLAFSECSNLKSIVWGKSVKTIGQNAFAYCYKLAEVIIPNTVTDISEYAFRLCKVMTKLHIPSSVINLNFRAFANCTALTDVTVGAGFKCDLTLNECTLSADVINGIIANYADNSGKTLTIGSTNLATLTDEDKAAAAAKGLTLA